MGTKDGPEQEESKYAGLTLVVAALVVDIGSAVRRTRLSMWKLPCH